MKTDLQYATVFAPAAAFQARRLLFVKIHIFQYSFSVGNMEKRNLCPPPTNTVNGNWRMGQKFMKVTRGPPIKGTPCRVLYTVFRVKRITYLPGSPKLNKQANPIIAVFRITCGNSLAGSQACQMENLFLMAKYYENVKFLGITQRSTQFYNF